jgi:hypothetical protein
MTMSLAVVHSRAQVGMEAPPVTVEVHLANGLPNLSIVGLPETAVMESKDRVRAALQNARFEFPARRITINLAPPICRRRAGASTSPSPSSPPPGRFRPETWSNTNSSANWRSRASCGPCSARSPWHCRRA